MNEKQHAATILPLIQDLRKSDGYNKYLLPKIQSRIDHHKNTVLHSNTLSAEERECHRRIYLELTQIIDDVDSDFHVNARILKDASDPEED